MDGMNYEFICARIIMYACKIDLLKVQSNEKN